MSRVTDMTGGNAKRLILKFSLPLILGNLGQQLYAIVDASIVGRGVGVSALASVGATDWICWMIIWTVIGLTQGLGTYVSRYFGKRDYKGVNKVITMSTLLCASVGAVLTLLGIVFARPMLELLKTPEDIIDGACLYLVTMVSGTLIVAAYNMTGAVLRGLGDGRTPLVAMVIAAVTNIGLDLLFVLVFHWGIFGAAVASLVAQLISFAFCLVRMLKIDFIKLDREAWSLDIKLLKELFVFGIPLAIQYIIISLGGIILQSTVNLQGSYFIAGYTATNKLYGLLESTAISLGIACSTFVSQNYGARNFDRVREGVRSGAVLAVGMAVGILTSVLILGKYLLRLFLDLSEEGGPEAFAVAYKYLVIMALSLIVLYLIHVYRNALLSIGNSAWPLYSGIAEFFIRVSMAKLFTRLIGIDVLYYIEPAAWVGAFVVCLAPWLYYQKRFK
ncbi:MAG: MATE family efflux transporter [Clostridia bacterium]|nr:MATE family efflux transporter [Clostridia bacterium]